MKNIKAYQLEPFLFNRKTFSQMELINELNVSKKWMQNQRGNINLTSPKVLKYLDNLIESSEILSEDEVNKVKRIIAFIIKRIKVVNLATMLGFQKYFFSASKQRELKNFIRKLKKINFVKAEGEFNVEYFLNTLNLLNQLKDFSSEEKINIPDLSSYLNAFEGHSISNYKAIIQKKLIESFKIHLELDSDYKLATALAEGPSNKSEITLEDYKTKISKWKSGKDCLTLNSIKEFLMLLPGIPVNSVKYLKFPYPGSIWCQYQFSLHFALWFYADVFEEK